MYLQNAGSWWQKRTRISNQTSSYHLVKYLTENCGSVFTQETQRTLQTTPEQHKNNTYKIDTKAHETHISKTQHLLREIWEYRLRTVSDKCH